MAVTKPLFINGVEYDAESERRGFNGLVAQSAPGGARTGVLGPAPAVSLSGSTVQVGPFNAAIGSAKGVYLAGVDSVTPATGTVAPADATNGRLDRVVLEVLDPDNGSAGTTRTGRLRVVPGTAAAIPVLPALPPLSLHVCQVSVPKSGSGNPTVIIDPPLTAAAGAPIPVRSGDERDAVAAVTGTMVQRLDRQGTLQHAVVSTTNGVTTTRWFEPGGVLGYKALVANSQLSWSSTDFVELPGFRLDFEVVGGRAVEVELAGVMSGIAGSKYVYDVRIDGLPVRRSEAVIESTRVETEFNLRGRKTGLAPGRHELRVYGAHRTGGGDYLVHSVKDNYGESYVIVRDDGAA